MREIKVKGIDPQRIRRLVSIGETPGRRDEILALVTAYEQQAQQLNEIAKAISYPLESLTAPCNVLSHAVTNLVRASDDLNDCRQILAAETTVSRSQPLPNPVNPFSPQTVACCLYAAIQELRTRRHECEQQAQEIARLKNAVDYAKEYMMFPSDVNKLRQKLAEAEAEIADLKERV